MKRDEIKIGGFYLVKVSGRICVVKILCVTKPKGWYAQNLHTGKHINIKSALRIRQEFKGMFCNCMLPLLLVHGVASCLVCGMRYVEQQVPVGILKHEVYT